jgi:hypothetical protein
MRCVGPSCLYYSQEKNQRSLRKGISKTEGKAGSGPEEDLTFGGLRSDLAGRERRPNERIANEERIDWAVVIQGPRVLYGLT